MYISGARTDKVVDDAVCASVYAQSIISYGGNVNIGETQNGEPRTPYGVCLGYIDAQTPAEIDTSLAVYTNKNTGNYGHFDIYAYDYGLINTTAGSMELDNHCDLYVSNYNDLKHPYISLQDVEIPGDISAADFYNAPTSSISYGVQ